MDGMEAEASPPALPLTDADEHSDGEADDSDAMRVFDRCFKGLVTLVSCSTAATRADELWPGHSVHYGEMKRDGRRYALMLFETYAPLSSAPPSARAFYDLGSGSGKCVIFIALHADVSHATGVELVHGRVEIARTAAARLSGLRPDVASRVHFREFSFLDADVRYADARWVFASNLWLSDEAQHQLFAKLADELPSGAVVLCSQPVPPPLAPAFELLEEKTYVPMTWDFDNDCRLYRRT